MTREARRNLRISSVNLESINFALAQLGDRLDELEGRRGTPKFKSNIDMGLNRVTQMQSGSASTDGATVVQVDSIADDFDSKTSGTQNLTASSTPGAGRLVMSPASDQHIDPGWINLLGKQDDVTASRAIGTVYQNTTGKSMFVTVVGKNGTLSSSMAAYTDSASTPVTLVDDRQSAANINYSVQFFVLAGNYYKVDKGSNNVTIVSWIEWY